MVFKVMIKHNFAIRQIGLPINIASKIDIYILYSYVGNNGSVEPSQMFNRVSVFSA